MQRSSPSIAALATALAKAQIELANPEKSLTGTIEPQAGEGGVRQFRYAPLSSGLEIVRKTLGQHEHALLPPQAAIFTILILSLAYAPISARGPVNDDIAAWFGVNSGRVAEIATNKTHRNVTRAINRHQIVTKHNETTSLRFPRCCQRFEPIEPGSRSGGNRGTKGRCE